MIAILLPIGLFLIMLVVGLGMRLAEFAALRRSGGAFGLGLTAQIVGLPLLAFGIARLFDLSPEMSVGLMVLAAAPGGVTSNFLTLLARGEVALSIAMTAATSLLSLVTVPLVVGTAIAVFLGQSETIRLPLGMTVGSVLVVTALPLIIGMTLRAKLSRYVVPIVPMARRIASLIFAAIVVATFWGQWAAIEQHWKSVGPAVFALNVTAMALGLGVARMLRLAPRPAIAIAVECGMQNVAVALFVTIGLLGVPELAIPAMIYAIAMNVSVLVMIAVGRQITARETGAAGGRDS
ncbi:MAG: bile acid:sodium symporter family protein [Hyphomicrobiales bacterium]|nr:bile acid:sodium symporter family protein [Hyphomicrobiales bacterium]